MVGERHEIIRCANHLTHLGMSVQKRKQIVKSLVKPDSADARRSELPKTRVHVARLDVAALVSEQRPPTYF